MPLMPRPSEWDWFPHLAIIYVGLVMTWVVLVLTGYLLFPGCHPCLVSPPPDSVLWRTVNLVWAITLLAGFPTTALWATWRVSMNEIRWRREGDPRAQ